jgi:DNA/RNA endonuclease G (NUC1)
MFDAGNFTFTPPVDMGSRYHDKIQKKHESHQNDQGADSVQFGGGQQEAGGYKRYDREKRTESVAETREDYGAKAQVQGYDENFLGAGMTVPLPKPTGKAAEQVLTFGNGETVRKYTHHSIIMNKERKMCMVTADNIDGPSLRMDIDRAKWQIDPVIGAENQLGEEIYKNNVLDKGHMVRRRDVVWGDKDTAAKANMETFYYPNACPQHARLNQEKWNDLENWLLQRADKEKQRLSVFTGPVFADNDMNYRGEKIPGQFYKIVVLERESDHQVAAAAFMMSQEDLLRNVDKQKQPSGGEHDRGETVPTEAVAPFQVTIDQIEKLTNLDFGGLKGVDAYALFQEGQKSQEAQQAKGTSPYSTYLADNISINDLPDLFPRYINSAQDIII